MTATRIARAEPRHAAQLTAIAFAAKRFWGYPESWIEQWRSTLTISPECVAANVTFIAIAEEVIVGFGAIRFGGEEPWIDHVWVIPSAMGQGTGRLLFDACETEARKRKAARLRIEADPNAEGFYRRMGARTVDRRPASIEGKERVLPIMEKSWSRGSSCGIPRRSMLISLNSPENIRSTVF